VVRKRKEFADGHHISQKWKDGVALQASDHYKRDMTDGFNYFTLVGRPVTGTTVLFA